MTENKSADHRRFMTRMLATGALLSMYTLGTLGVTSVVMTMSISTAVATQPRRGRGGYRAPAAAATRQSVPASRRRHRRHDRGRSSGANGAVEYA
jgi:hypothetical protein